MKPAFPHFFKQWLPWAFTVSLMTVMLCSTAQFLLRTGANYPQVQMARDIAEDISATGDHYDDPEFYATDKKVNARTLSPFVMIYDSDNTLIVANGELDADVPQEFKDLEVPVGVIDHTRKVLEHRVTLQPTPKVRLAAVAVQSPVGGPGHRDARVVLVARNISEVEERISQITLLLTGAWLIGMFGTAAIIGWQLRRS